MSEEQRTRILELAKECPPRFFRIVQQFFNVNPSSYDLNDLQVKLDQGMLLSCPYSAVYFGIMNDWIPLLKLYFYVTNMDINDQLGSFSQTPLTCAVMYNRQSVVAFLLEIGADIDVWDYVGNTPLQSALSSGRTEIAQFLLFKQYNVTLSNPMEIIKFLLDKPDEYYSNDDTLFSTLLYYASRINEEAFKLALTVSSVDDFYGIHPFFNNTLINLIVKWGHKTILKAAVEHGVDLNFNSDSGGEPLYNAVLHQTKMIPFMVKNGSDLHTNRDFLSDRYTTYGNDFQDVHRELFAKKHAKTVKIFEKCGVDIHLKLSSDENELHHICRHATKVKPFLLAFERGADINHVNRKNWTPLKFVLEDDLLKRYINSRTPIDFLVSVLTKMMENKDFVSQDNIECLSDERVRYFHDRCKKEIDRLKKTKITESICRYDFLTSDLQKLTTLARNKELMKQLRLQKINSVPSTHCPSIYDDHLKRSYERSVWRFKQMEKTFKIIEDWILPEMVFEKICGFLNDKELRMSKYYFILLKQFLSKN